MFALEVIFKDGSTPAAMIFVRRPQALIGSSSFANVVLDDMKSVNFQLRLIRNLGRTFSTAIMPSHGPTMENVDPFAFPSGLEGVFQGQKLFDLGPVKIEIIALDSDLILREGETPDKAGVRVLRLATTAASSRFPALVTGSPPIVVSFNPEIPIIIGRSRPCAMRIESADVSGRHARVGYDGESFWVEDLGSTNGTFVRGTRVSGKTKVAPGESIMIARDCVVVGVTAEKDLNRLVGGPQEVSEVRAVAAPTNKFPALLSLSQVAKPHRLAIVPGTSMKIGRDLGCDMWLGAPHVSRQHLSVFMGDDGIVKITDQSTYGTEHDLGRLSQGQTLTSDSKGRVLNFGAGITVALCFNEEQEKQFSKALGAVAAFGELATDESDSPSAKNSDQVKITDVSKLLGRRGRQATAHHLQTLYGSGPKSVKIWFWLAAIGILLAASVAIGLIIAILF